MAEWVEQYWEPDPNAGTSRRTRRGGRYQAYVPDLLNGRPISIPQELASRAAAVERSIRGLGDLPGAGGLSAISRLLTRSEAISSSMIEGIAPSSQQVAIAELALSESVRGVSEKAQMVANNIVILGRASRELVARDSVTAADIEAMHAALLPDERYQGVRTVQNWIGGSNWNPLEADFVPPAPELVPGLLHDLVGYMNGAGHGALVQAALVHAQFETIHPFTDGNGRVGRALIHTVLARGGLSPEAVLPISMVLATFRDRYVEGLTRYRYDGASTAEDGTAGHNAWLEVFVEASGLAVDQAIRIAHEVADLDADWHDRVVEHRTAQGIRGEPRANSAVARILALLPEMPVLTGRAAERVLGITFAAARSALEELAEAGVLGRKSLDRGTTGYLARDILDLVTIAERRLASTEFDTRSAPPNRPVPNPPM
ncbi:Fic family protein [Tsukamurella tyrosinosolvens]|uniref:Fic family protein n=1 Tax=Tsukamurella tyrosinosolvens TaxID=57704 RepID=UPI001AF976B6|nr:Fic family protein [Tsukamurella tyrosinosolvens]QRY84653.1 Fic family protein [Tsukamurella tyrosinosolvens]